MRKFLLLFLILFVVNISAQTPNPIVQNIISQVNIDSLKKYVNELSGEVPVVINGSEYTITSRHSNNAMNDIAADYIEAKLQSYGLQVFNHNYDSNGRNVYAVQQGTVYPDQQYIICAHYDNMPGYGAAPGADDNASGVAGVIEAARILSNYETMYTIIYALWDEEEQGLIGSYYYAARAASQNDDIKGVINLDMIAFDNNNDGRVNIHTRSTGNSTVISSKMVQVISTYSIPLTYYINNPGSTYSDHASFWQRGFPAILLIEDDYYNDFNFYYHTANDKIQYFNNNYFHNSSKLAIGTLSELVGVNMIVPVELVSFSGNQFGNKVILNWTTATETNNFGFEIERAKVNSENKSNQFNVIGFVEGKGTTAFTSNYNYNDASISGGGYLYRLKQIDYDGTHEYSDEIFINTIKQMTFELYPNYPNPFNPSTTISYQIPVDGNVSLKVYNLLGNEVKTLVNDYQSAGNHKIEFDAAELSSGNYFYILKYNDQYQKGKMTFLK